MSLFYVFNNKGGSSANHLVYSKLVKTETQEYNILLSKLDAFIRKYYINRMIKGAIYLTITCLFLFLAVSIAEYFGRYSTSARAGLFFTFISTTLFLLLYWVLIPLAYLSKIGKQITHEQASAIIGQHFPEVADRLLNVLQLKQLSTKQNELLEAAIAQKAKQLEPIPFVAAVKLNQTIRFMRWLLFPVGVYVLIYLVAPGMIQDAGERVINYNEQYKPQAPFSFIILNKDLRVEQFSDYELLVETEGTILPDEVYLATSSGKFKMVKKDKHTFAFVFANVAKNTEFVFVASGFESEKFLLKTIAKPLLLSFSAELNYPAYTQKAKEKIQNPGDLTLPQGTIIKWILNTKQADGVRVVINKSSTVAEMKNTGVFTVEKKAMATGPYWIKLLNTNEQLNDSVQYQLWVVPDAYPQITVDEKRDSVQQQISFMVGDISDDYGVTRLAFYYQLKQEGSTQAKPRVIQWVPIQPKIKSQRFYHQFNISELQLQPGDALHYYFEVWDNDGVNGSKSTKTPIREWKMATTAELEQKQTQGSNKLKEKMQEALTRASDLQKELKSLERDMVDKKELTWEEKKKLEKLLEQQKQLAKQLAEIKQENEQLNKQESTIRKQEQQLLEKQEQLQKLFNELMDDEMKKLIREMEKLLEKQQKDQLKQELDKLQLSNKDVEKELDRMLEQYKKLELEKKLEQVNQKLDDLAEKQEQLSNQTKENDQQLSKKEKEDQTKQQLNEQQKLTNEFQELKEQLDKIEQENKEMEEPSEIENTDQLEKDIGQQQQESEQELSKGQQKKASEKQQKAADQLKKMSQQLKQNQSEQEQEELELDAQALREILENTIQLSKDQESLMDRMKTINGYNPQFVEAAQVQQKIKDNAKIIEDSLQALSKRVVEISSYVNREVSKMNDNLDKSVSGYGMRNFWEIRTRQQSTMMHANNLAVMLSELLKQMQDKMNGEGQSSGKSGKPQKGGKGKGGKGGSSKGKSMSELKKAQEELNKQLREGLNKQQQPNGKEPGANGKPQPGKGGQMGSEEFAKLAAQQQAIRQQMQMLMQQMGSKEKEGMGGQKQLQEMQRLMEQTEKELFNKRLSAELLMRQQDILTRMLESEKAERKQEQDQKREAEQAKQLPPPNPPSFENYLKQKRKEQELLETIPIELQPYYKDKAKEYFNKIGNKAD